MRALLLFLEEEEEEEERVSSTGNETLVLCKSVRLECCRMLAITASERELLIL